MNKVLDIFNCIHYKLFNGDWVTLVIVVLMIGMLIAALKAAPTKPPRLTAFTLTEDVTIHAKLKDGNEVELSAHKGNIIFLEAEVNEKTVAMAQK